MTGPETVPVDESDDTDAGHPLDGAGDDVQPDPDPAEQGVDE